MILTICLRHTTNMLYFLMMIWAFIFLIVRGVMQVYLFETSCELVRQEMPLITTLQSRNGCCVGVSCRGKSTVSEAPCY